MASTPKKRVLVLTSGTRGDAQPFIAMSYGLKRAGCAHTFPEAMCDNVTRTNQNRRGCHVRRFEVMMLTNPDHEKLCADTGCPFTPNGLPIKGLFTSPGAVRAFRSNNFLSFVNVTEAP